MEFVFPDELQAALVDPGMDSLLLCGRLQMVKASLLQLGQRVTKCSLHVLVQVEVSWLKMGQNVHLLG